MSVEVDLSVPGDVRDLPPGGGLAAGAEVSELRASGSHWKASKRCSSLAFPALSRTRTRVATEGDRPSYISKTENGKTLWSPRAVSR